MRYLIKELLTTGITHLHKPFYAHSSSNGWLCDTWAMTDHFSDALVASNLAYSLIVKLVVLQGQFTQDYLVVLEMVS